MVVQHVAQHVDTIFVALPRAIDSMRIGDTVHAIVRQAGGEGATVATLFLGFASFAVAAALVFVTYRASNSMERLQATNNDYQKQLAELQREFNRMQVQREEERRAAEEQLAREHQRAVDARLSGIAYALRRQMRSWVAEVPKRPIDIVTDSEGAKRSDIGLFTGEGLTWARARGGQDFDRAEDRAHILIAGGPEASRPVAEAIQRAFVLFYRATARVNQQARSTGPVPAAPAELEEAVRELERCIETLDLVVGPELQQADVAT